MGAQYASPAFQALYDTRQASAFTPMSTANTNTSSFQNYAIASSVVSGIAAIGGIYSQYSSMRTQEIQMDSANTIAGYQAEATAAQYGVSALQSRTAAKAAEMEGNYISMEMKNTLNTTLASNVVMSAAQNRRGGSSEAMNSAATANLQWDLDFTKLSTDIKTGNLNAAAAMSDAKNNTYGSDMANASYNPYGDAARTSLVAGSTSAITGSAMNIGMSLYSIGGKA